MTKARSVLAGVLMGAILATVPAMAEGWAQYDAGKFGFSMLVPSGTKLVEKDWGGGWAELWGEHEGVKVYALCKLGEQATPEEIESVGVKVTAIPAEAWKEIDSGKNSNGWNWYKTVVARTAKMLVFGGYGTSKRGSYLVVLATTPADFDENRADYDAWYESVKLR